MSAPLVAGGLEEQHDPSADSAAILAAVGEINSGIAIALYDGARYRKIGGRYHDLETARLASANGANQSEQAGLPAMAGYLIERREGRLVLHRGCERDGRGRFRPCEQGAALAPFHRAFAQTREPLAFAPGPRARPSALAT